MKIVLLFLLTSLSSVCIAQTEQETLKELREIIEGQNLEFYHITSGYLMISYQDGDFNLSYKFAPNDATWEGRDYAIFADWNVVEQTKEMGDREDEKITYKFPFAADNKELNMKVANLINHLATFDKNPPMTNREDIYDEDLIRFHFDHSDLTELLQPSMEKLVENLDGYTTDPEKLRQNYFHVKNNGELADLTTQEQKDYRKTVRFFEEQRTEIEKISEDFFNETNMLLPENQFTTILNMINSDPEFADRFQKAITEFYK